MDTDEKVEYESQSLQKFSLIVLLVDFEKLVSQKFQ